LPAPVLSVPEIELLVALIREYGDWRHQHMLPRLELELAGTNTIPFRDA
jgi:hypothetical protein